MRRPIQTQAGFTLVEMMVVTALTALLGGVIYVVLSSGLVLFAKNTSVNLAHQEARSAVIQMEKQLHLAVSPPQLVDANRAAVSGTGPAAGISFQVFAAGPFKVAANASVGDSKVTMALGTYQPKAGQRLIIPSHNIALDIAADCSGSGNQAVLLSGTLATAIATQMNQAGTMVPKDVIGFITDRVTFVINNGSLLYYAKAGANALTLTRDLTSATPFSQPVNSSGNPNSRSIAAFNLSTGSDTNGTNQGTSKYRSANMFINAEVPARALLTNTP